MDLKCKPNISATNMIFQRLTQPFIPSTDICPAVTSGPDEALPLGGMGKQDPLVQQLFPESPLH